MLTTPLMSRAIDAINMTSFVRKLGPQSRAIQMGAFSLSKHFNKANHRNNVNGGKGATVASH